MLLGHTTFSETPISSVEEGGTLAGAVRASQLLIEAVTQTDAAARASQLVVETLQDVQDTSAPPLSARASQLLLEALYDVPVAARASQLILEVLRTINDQIPKGPRGFYFGRSGGNDILKYGLSHQDDP